MKWHEPDETGGEDMVVTYHLFMSPAPKGWAGPVDGKVRAMAAQQRLPGINVEIQAACIDADFAAGEAAAAAALA